MTDDPFDRAGLFDEDYLYFYEEVLSDDRSDADTDLIWELLDFAPGMRVLDLACGHGRIANRLAERGCDVTGLDATPLFLEVARQDAAARGVAVAYVEGDMRALPWSGRYDRVISWFTAFGYFDDDGNRQVLTEIARVLAPGGVVGIDLVNRDWLARQFQPARVTDQGGDLMIERSRMDPLTGRTVSERMIVRDGHVRRIRYFVRMFVFTELRDWMSVAGLTDVKGYGDNGEPLTATSRRMVTTARRRS